MNWTWERFWSWYSQIENQETALKEFGDTRWVSNLSTENQMDVFKFAPEEVKEKFAKYIKPEAKKKLGLSVRKNSTQMDIATLFGAKTRF